jgi:SHS2 domain-containing protein
MADGKWQMANPAQGETLELERHHQRADVKAVTLRRFRLEHTGEGWVAEVILDR